MRAFILPADAAACLPGASDKGSEHNHSYCSLLKPFRVDFFLLKIHMAEAPSRLGNCGVAVVCNAVVHNCAARNAGSRSEFILHFGARSGVIVAGATNARNRRRSRPPRLRRVAPGLCLEHIPAPLHWLCRPHPSRRWMVPLSEQESLLNRKTRSFQSFPETAGAQVVPSLGRSCEFLSRWGRSQSSTPS